MSDQIDATVTRSETSYCLALDEYGRTYLCPAQNFQTSTHYGFAHVRVGTIVRLTPVEGPKGWRGLEVRIVTR